MPCSPDRNRIMLYPVVLHILIMAMEIIAMEALLIHGTACIPRSFSTLLRIPEVVSYRYSQAMDTATMEKILGR